MRHVPLRLVLIASAALGAFPAFAQDAPVITPPPGATDPIVIRPPEVRPPADAPPAPAEAVAPPIPEIWSPVPVDAQGRSAYGLYLSGRLANFRGDRSDAAILLTQTEALTPEQPGVRDEAFITTLLSGDLGVAARLAPQGADAPAVLSDAGRLADIVETWAAGDPRAAFAVLTQRPVAQPHTRAGDYIAPWLAAAAGDWDTALKPLDGAPTDPTSLFRRQARALLLEQRRRYDEADTEFKALIAAPVGVAFRTTYGGFLERRGRRTEALAQYDAALASGTQDPDTIAARANLQAGGRPAAAPTFAEGAADGLTIASYQAAAEGAPDLAPVYLRMALVLHPGDVVLEQLGRAWVAVQHEQAARDAWAHISPANPQTWARARANIGVSFARDNQPEAALDAFRQAAAVLPDEPPIAFAFANQLHVLGHDEEALAQLNRPALANARQPFDVRFLRGAVLEALNRHDEAEAELWAALQLRPNDPEALNYLGYLWVDSGRRVDQGAEMIARAHAVAPTDANIQDSLGWAQFKQGRFETAVATLEEAVAKQPANPEIVDHLGDAYWRVGREREAGWQWTRVLTLTPDAERRAEVEKKLAEGLAAPAPAAVS